MADVADRDQFVGSRPRRSARSTERLRLVVGAYLGGSILWVMAIGLPVERIVILAWLFGLLAVAIASDGLDRLRSLARDWGLFAALLIAYRYSAGLADSVGRPVAIEGLANIDRAIGLGEVPTVRLQQTLDQSGQAPWWQVPLSFVYVSHFFGILIAAAVLWFQDRVAWVGYTKRLLTLAAAAVLTYILVPAAPPWMAADAGVIEPIQRSPFLGWERVGLGIVEPVVEQGRAVANPVAALPSMHAGFALFIAVVFWSRVGRVGRAALGSYALSMAFTLVLTGEHWVADVLLGWLYVAVVMLGWSRWDRRRGATQSSGTRRNVDSWQ